MDDEIGYITPTEETEDDEYLLSKSMRNKNKKMIMLAAATPSKAGKKTNSIVSKVALKKNNEQVENNSNAIELLEASLMQTVNQLQEKNQLLEDRLAAIETKHMADNKALILKNEELTDQLDVFKNKRTNFSTRKC